ncbi:hypothetical protein AAFN88_11995 [Pelagibius sp. CAU 1746]|uniref:beta strand repeat-containing protein n=1 Tax=Pelagibius sp. CAU 1746 TaxID=3140370 RepID=UPI00325BB6F6
MTEEFKQVGGEPETRTEIEAMDTPAAPTVEGSAGSDSLTGQAPRVISPPPAGQTDVVRLEPGERFELAANPATVQLVVDGNNLVMGFDLDGDGQPDSFVVFEDLVLAAGSGNPPGLVVAGEVIGMDLLLSNAVALAQAEESGAAPLETAVGDTATGGGNNVYSDNLGEAIDLLVAQGVIPPVELQFGLIELEDEIVLLEPENDPPVADPVLTPAERPGDEGELPPALEAALAAVGSGGGPVTINFEDLANGEDVNTQYPGVTFSVEAGGDLEAYGNEPAITDSPPNVLVDRSFTEKDITVEFDSPVNGLTFKVAGDNVGALGSVDVYENGILSATVPLTGDGNPFTTELVDLSGFTNVTKIVIHDTVDGDLIAFDDFSYTGGISPDSVVFFKQLDVDGIIGDDDSGIIADFGGADNETSLENLVFTLQSEPTYGQLILVTAGGDTSFLTPGDTFSSEDTVWWIATEDDISDFLAQPGAPEFLPNVDFLYNVTDEAGSSDTAPVVITVPPPTPPRAALGVFEETCLNEDTEGQLLFSAHPTDGASKISQIVLSGFPTGDVADAWVVDDTSVDIFGYTLGVDYTADYDAVSGELTITFITANFSLGEAVQGTVDVTPNPDSDVDEVLTIEATAINGAGQATDIEDSLIPVDADADSGPGAVGGADDGDGDVLSVSATVFDEDGEVPENSTFQAGETGTLNVQATFDDFTDGSETHTIAVFAPGGFTILAIDPEDLPDGVTLISNSGSIAVFDVETVDGVGSVDFDLDIQNTGAGEGDYNFLVRVIAEETSTGDVECVDGGEGGIFPTGGDNVAYDEILAPTTVAIIEEPTVLLSLPPEVECIEEDSSGDDPNNEVTVDVTPNGNDLLTQIVISGLDSSGDWTYDFTGLGGAGITVDDTNLGTTGEVLITFDTPANAQYIGTFTVEPPEDSDLDHPTITATATVVDPEDPFLSTTGDGTLDIVVDAVADGGAYVDGTPDTSDAGAVADLNLTLTPRGHASGTPDDENPGGFDTDGSEAVSQVVVELSGDAGAVLTSSNLVLFGNLLTSNVGQVWTFEGSEAELTTLLSTLQVDPSDSFEGDITVDIDVTTTEFATEAGAPNDDGVVEHGEECDDGNNAVTESFQFIVPVDNVAEPEALIFIDQAECLTEDTEGTLGFSATPLGAGDAISQIVITGFPTGADAWSVDVGSLSLTGLTLNVDYTVDDSNLASSGELTINMITQTPDTAVTGTINVTPDEDSDIDGALTINATAVDGIASATSDNDPTTIPVDAAADGGAYVDGTPGTSDSGAVTDLNLTLTPRGHASGTPDDENPGGFDTDGSEAVSQVVVELSGDAGAVLTSSNLVLFGNLLTSNVGQVWTFEGSEAELTTLLSTLQVDPSDSFDGDITVDIDVTTTEFATVAGNPTNDDGVVEHGIECTDANNAVTESFQFTVTVDNVAEPEALIFIDQAECLTEDTEGTLGFSATPIGTGDAISQIVITGFPTGADAWSVDVGSLSLTGLTLNVDYTVDDSNLASSGELTINMITQTPDTAVTGTINVTPDEDSDIDGALTINATAVDGIASATSDNDPTTIPVDAAADGGAYVDGTPGTSDSGAVTDLNLTLTPRGHASGTPDDENPGGFDTDGSEAVSQVVVELSGDAGAVLTSSNLVLFGNLLTSNVGQVWTFEGSEADLTTLLSTLQVDPSDSFDGDITVDIDVTTTEFATVAGNPTNDDGVVEHGIECTDSNNAVTESFQFTVTVDNTAEPEAVIGVDGDECLFEDTEGTLAFSATPIGTGDAISQIVITGFPTGADAWDVDVLSLVLTGLTLNVDYTVDDSNLASSGELTINMITQTPDTAVSGTIDVTPNEDSDVDGALTINATAVDGIASSTSNNDPTPIPVDAVADGVSGSGGDDGDSDHLSVDISIVDNGGDNSFQTGEMGVLTIDATFDDYQDGSEEHLVTITAADGYFIGSAISLPAGVTVDSNDGTTLVLRVDSLDGDGQDGVGSFTATFNITNVAADEGTVNFTAVASAEELNTNLVVENGDAECTLENNYAEDTDSEPVTADDPDREILNTGVITNTNSQGQKGIITFYDQANILINAFAGYVVFSVEGQALSQANDTGFIIEEDTEYTYGFEADPGNASRIGLDELSLEGVDLTEPANIYGMGPDGTPGATNFALTGRFEPNGTEVQVGTESEDGDTGANNLSDPNVSPTVDYIWGDLGADTVTGGSGSDILNGGPGADSVSGGAGNDIIVYDTADTIDGGAGDDLIRIDAIGPTITTFNDGGDTFINLTSITTEIDYVSTNIDNVEGLLITDQPTFKAGDIVQGVTLIDNDMDGDIDEDDHAFMADIGVKVNLEPADVIDHADGDGDELWIQGNEGDIINLVDTDGGDGSGNDWHFQSIVGDFAEYTWGATSDPGDTLATVYIEVGTIGDSSIDVQIDDIAVLTDGQIVP